VYKDNDTTISQQHTKAAIRDKDKESRPLVSDIFHERGPAMGYFRKYVQYECTNDPDSTESGLRLPGFGVGSG